MTRREGDLIVAGLVVDEARCDIGPGAIAPCVVIGKGLGILAYRYRNASRRIGVGDLERAGLDEHSPKSRERIDDCPALLNVEVWPWRCRHPERQ